MSEWRRWFRSPSFRMAFLVAGAALMASLVTVIRGWHPDPVVPVTSGITMASSALEEPPALSPVDVPRATEADLFADSRNAPAERYRMPGEVAAHATVLASAPSDSPKPVVLGTAIAADGNSFATCQFQSDRLLMVRVGDRVGSYTVKSIARDRVVFTGADGKLLEVLAPRAGS